MAYIEKEMFALQNQLINFFPSLLSFPFLSSSLLFLLLPSSFSPPSSPTFSLSHSHTNITVTHIKYRKKTVFSIIYFIKLPALKMLSFDICLSVYVREGDRDIDREREKERKYVCVLHACMSVYQVCAVPTETRRQSQSLQNWCYRWLQITMQVLCWESNPGPVE